MTGTANASANPYAEISFGAAGSSPGQSFDPWLALVSNRMRSSASSAGKNVVHLQVLEAPGAEVHTFRRIAWNGRQSEAGTIAEQAALLGTRGAVPRGRGAAAVLRV